MEADDFRVSGIQTFSSDFSGRSFTELAGPGIAVRRREMRW